MRQKDLSVVFHSEFTLNERKTQITDLGHHAAEQRQYRHCAIFDIAIEPAVHHKCKQQAAAQITQQAANGTLYGLLGADFGRKLMLTQGKARKIGKGVAGEAKNKGQQQISAADARSIDPQEGRE